MSETEPPSAFWNRRYQQVDRLWSTAPNAVLAALTPDLSPGRALDLGAGEGADAIWLAERGWTVTAVDVSPTALSRGRQRAEHLGNHLPGRITWIHADLTIWEPPISASTS